MRNPLVYHGLRTIAGGYLTYLGIQILRNGVLSGEMAGRQRTFGWVASLLFIVVGIFFAIHSLRGLIRALRQGGEAEQTEAGEEKNAEEAPSPEVTGASRSLFDRARGQIDDEEDED